MNWRIFLRFHYNELIGHDPFGFGQEVCGNMPVTKAQILPSDHYGVVIDIT